MPSSVPFAVNTSATGTAKAHRIQCLNLHTGRDSSLFDPRAPLYRVNYPELNVTCDLHVTLPQVATPTRRLVRETEILNARNEEALPEHSSKLQQDDSESRCAVESISIKVSETHSFVTFSSGRAIHCSANTIRLRHHATETFDASKVMLRVSFVRSLTLDSMNDLCCVEPGTRTNFATAGTMFD
ncbi:hypothetical protein C8R45DRAFT_1094712 [Mycena sanguinolenta]|nr:hypothetical protein C8R45DRAFT_1094712 [Mycena sanguinolenta]